MSAQTHELKIQPNLVARHEGAGGKQLSAFVSVQHPEDKTEIRYLYEPSPRPVEGTSLVPGGVGRLCNMVQLDLGGP